MKSILILHDIRSSENVGSLIRTADATGISEVYLSGYTPSPLDKFGRPNTKIAKAALGAENTIAWKMIEDIEQLLFDLKNQGVQVIAVEQSPNAKDYKTVAVRFPVAIMLGNEVSGLPEVLLQNADEIAEIPMKGKKESLNVAVAGGIALYRLLGV